MFIRVISCSNNNYWYSNLIGKEFEVWKEDLGLSAYIIKNIDGNEQEFGNVFYEDCEQVATIQEDRRFIPDRKKTGHEILEDKILFLENENIEQAEIIVDTDYRLTKLELGL